MHSHLSVSVTVVEISSQNYLHLKYRTFSANQIADGEQALIDIDEPIRLQMGAILAPFILAKSHWIIDCQPQI